MIQIKVQNKNLEFFTDRYYRVISTIQSIIIMLYFLLNFKFVSSVFFFVCNTSIFQSQIPNLKPKLKNKINLNPLSFLSRQKHDLDCYPEWSWESSYNKFLTWSLCDLALSFSRWYTSSFFPLHGFV